LGSSPTSSGTRNSDCAIFRAKCKSVLLPELPELNGFVAKNLNADRLIKMSSHRAVIASLDDPIVPHAKTERLSFLLKAKLHLVKSGGHFLATDGFTQLPEAYEELSVMVKKD
jgi:uncharacterized protein